GPQPPMGPPPNKSNAGLIVVAIVAALVLVGGVLGGAYYLAGGGESGGDDTRAGSSPSARSTSSSSSSGPGPISATGENKPSYYNSMKSWSLWNSLNTASQDSRPVTLSEVFNDPGSKSEKDSLDGTYFNLQGTGRIDTDCTSAVWGQALKTAV